MSFVVTVRTKDPERYTANQSVPLGPLQLIIPVLLNAILEGKERNGHFMM